MAGERGGKEHGYLCHIMGFSKPLQRRLFDPFSLDLWACEECATNHFGIGGAGQIVLQLIP